VQFKRELSEKRTKSHVQFCVCKAEEPNITYQYALPHEIEGYEEGGQDHTLDLSQPEEGLIRTRAGFTYLMPRQDRDPLPNDTKWSPDITPSAHRSGLNFPASGKISGSLCII